jgi:predicted NAD/FAD-binding protein
MQEDGGRWSVATAGAEPRSFHQVVFACPADAALALLGGAASDAERDALGAFEFAPNVAYVHSDAALMPRRRAAWSAWNYMGGGGGAGGDAGATKPVFVTYWVSRLRLRLRLRLRRLRVVRVVQ